MPRRFRQPRLEFYERHSIENNPQRRTDDVAEPTSPTVPADIPIITPSILEAEQTMGAFQDAVNRMRRAQLGSIETEAMYRNVARYATPDMIWDRVANEPMPARRSTNNGDGTYTHTFRTMADPYLLTPNDRADSLGWALKALDDPRASEADRQLIADRLLDSLSEWLSRTLYSDPLMVRQALADDKTLLGKVKIMRREYEASRAREVIATTERATDQGADTQQGHE